MRIFGPFDGNRDDVVVVKDLDGALGAADAACDERTPSSPRSRSAAGYQQPSR